MGNEKKAGNAEPKQKPKNRGGVPDSIIDPEERLRRQQAESQQDCSPEVESQRFQQQMEVERISDRLNRTTLNDGCGYRNKFGQRQAQG